MEQKRYRYIVAKYNTLIAFLLFGIAFMVHSGTGFRAASPPRRTVAGLAADWSGGSRSIRPWSARRSGTPERCPRRPARGQFGRSPAARLHSERVAFSCWTPKHWLKYYTSNYRKFLSLEFEEKFEILSITRGKFGILSRTWGKFEILSLTWGKITRDSNFYF